MSQQHMYPKPLLKTVRRRSQNVLQESFIYRTGLVSPFQNATNAEHFLSSSSDAANAVAEQVRGFVMPASLQPGI